MKMTQDIFQYDFPEFTVGTAEYPKGPTGCTVFHFPNGALATSDVRGGAAAVRESTLLDPIAESGMIDALVFAGGSTYGLDAASGVMSWLLEKRGNSVRFMDIPSVPAAVVYDFSGRKNAIFPDQALGKKAVSEAKANRVLIGAAGAGRSVSVGKYLGRDYAETSGQGAAFFEKDGLKIFAFTVVNALGNILDRSGNVIAGSMDKKSGKRLDLAEHISSPAQAPSRSEPGNTTLSLIVTNAKINRLDLKRISIMAHTSMGRVIEPFHTPMDGDVLFSTSTGSFSLKKSFNISDLGVISGHLLQKAVLSPFQQAK